MVVLRLGVSMSALTVVPVCMHRHLVYVDELVDVYVWVVFLYHQIIEKVCFLLIIRESWLILSKVSLYPKSVYGVILVRISWINAK